MNGMNFSDGEEADGGTEGMEVSFRQPLRAATEPVACLRTPNDRISASGEAHGFYAQNQLAQTS